MSILDGIKTSTPTAVAVFSIIAVMVLVAVFLIAFVITAENADHERRLTKRGILPERQLGKSRAYYFWPILALIMIIALGPLIGWKLGEAVSGGSPESSTVQTETPEER